MMTFLFVLLLCLFCLWAGVYLWLRAAMGKRAKKHCDICGFEAHE